MIGKFLSKEDIYEPSLDIPLNWSDMRSMFGYKLLSEISESSYRFTSKILSLFTSNSEEVSGNGHLGK